MPTELAAPVVAAVALCNRAASGAGSNVASVNNGFAGSMTSANLELQGGVYAGNAAVLASSTAG